MESNQMKDWLKELYQLDPQLKSFENQLIEIINQMRELKPETHFNAELAANIKTRLMLKINEVKAKEEEKSAFSFNIIKLRKKTYAYTGLAVVFVLALAAIITSNPSFLRSNQQINITDKSQSASYDDWLERNQDDYAQLGERAFGSLALLSLADSDNLRQGTKQVEMIGDKIAPAMETLVLGSDEQGSVFSDRMIMPWYNYSYNYQGEDLVLDKSEGGVYRRLSSSSNDSTRLAKLVNGLSLNGLSLASFNNLQAESLILSEDIEEGLSVYLDFKAASVNIYQNWDRWESLANACDDNDLRCLAKFDLKIEDFPSDESLVKQANEFLAKHQIDVSSYGEPIVDNNWRNEFTIASDQSSFYIPEQVSVIYPFQVAGMNLRDQSGDYSGVRVNINILKKLVTGLDNLSSNKFEFSNYQLETDFQRILKIAEKGAWGSWPMGGFPESEVIELSLGTPEFSYIKLWRYEDNKNEELLVPALIFPVIVDDNLEYYGQRSVIVPLVKEMLAELELNQSNQGNGYSGGTIEPVPMPMPFIR